MSSREKAGWQGGGVKANGFRGIRIRHAAEGGIVCVSPILCGQFPIACILASFTYEVPALLRMFVLTCVLFPPPLATWSPCAFLAIK